MATLSRVTTTYTVRALALSLCGAAAAFSPPQVTARGSVEACINDADGNLLVEDWTLQVFRYGASPYFGSAPVDPQRGTARFEGVPPGNWTVSAGHIHSGARVEATVTVTPGASTEVVLVAHSVPVDRLLRVLAEPQQLLRAFGMQPPVLSSAMTGPVPLVGNGILWWEFGPVGDEEHDLSVVDPRFVLRTSSGLRRGLANSLALEGSSGLRVLARAPDGTALCPTAIALVGGELQPWQVNVPLDEDATLTGLVASTYTVTVGFDHHTAQVIEGVRLVPGTVTTLEFVGPPVVTLKGLAVDQHGKPLVGAAVRVSEVYGFAREGALGLVQGLTPPCRRNTVTDQNGEFTALRLRDGVFQVVVVPAGGRFTDWLDWLVELPTHGDHRVTIAPGTFGRVDVDVTGRAGERAFVVELQPALADAPPSAPLRQITGSSGRATFERVPLGRYTVRASAITAVEGEARETSLDVQPQRSSLVRLAY